MLGILSSAVSLFLAFVARTLCLNNIRVSTAVFKAGALEISFRCESIGLSAPRSLPDEYGTGLPRATRLHMVPPRK